MFSHSILKWALLGAMLMVNAAAHSQTPQDHVSLGTLAFLKGELSLAEREADLALEMDKHSAEAWRLKGRVAMVQKEFHQAKKQFARAGKFTSYNQAELFVLKGWACDSLGQTNQALKAFAQSTQADSIFHAAWLEGAKVLNREQRYVEALAWGLKATETDGLNPDAWVEYGISLMLTDSVVDGLNQLEQALRLQPAHVRANLFKALAFESLFELEEAYAVMSRLLSKHAEDASLYGHFWRIRKIAESRYELSAEDLHLLPENYAASEEAWLQTRIAYAQIANDREGLSQPPPVERYKHSSLGTEVMGWMLFRTGYYGKAHRLHRKSLRMPESRPDKEFLKLYCRIFVQEPTKKREKSYSLDKNEQTFITTNRVVGH